MSARTFLVVLLAVICGVSAAMGVLQLRGNSNRASTAGQVETIPVLVTAREVPRGRMMSAEDIRVSQWPKDLVPKGTLSSPDEAIERSAAYAMCTGEPIFESKLASRDAGRGLAALIPLGMRAYTIQSTRAPSNVAGFVLPGNKVDVLLSLRSSGNNDETGGGTSTTLLQAVEILAINQELDAPADNKLDTKALTSVTLLVTPQQATMLDLGQNLGQLTLALRNPEDKSDAKWKPATLADIRFRQERPVVPPAPKPEPKPVVPVKKEPQVSTIVTLKGDHRGMVRVTLP